MDEIWNEAQETETVPEAEPFYNRHYITVDTRGRITDGWSDGPCPDRDAAGAVCIDEQGEYQFRLAPDGEENPPLYAMDGVPLYRWDGGKAVLRTQAELEADRILPLEQVRKNKLTELSDICNSAIITGCDVTLSDGSTGHISLTNEDQINLTNAYSAVKSGAEIYPYHLDGQLCALYSASDIITIAQAAIAHKLYHTTYYNHLVVWVQRCETIDEVQAIIYGTKLPEDIAKHMIDVLATVKDK